MPAKCPYLKDLKLCEQSAGKTYGSEDVPWIRCGTSKSLNVRASRRSRLSQLDVVASQAGGSRTTSNLGSQLAVQRFLQRVYHVEIAQSQYFSPGRVESADRRPVASSLRCR